MPPKPAGVPSAGLGAAAGTGAGGDSSSESESEDAPPPKAPSLGRLPLPIGKAKNAASSGGAVGGIVTKPPTLQNRAAWASLGRPKPSTGAPLASTIDNKAWDQAVAARKASQAQKDLV